MSGSQEVGGVQRIADAVIFICRICRIRTLRQQPNEGGRGKGNNGLFSFFYLFDVKFAPLRMISPSLGFLVKFESILTAAIYCFGE